MDRNIMRTWRPLSRLCNAAALPPAANGRCNAGLVTYSSEIRSKPRPSGRSNVRHASSRTPIRASSVKQQVPTRVAQDGTAATLSTQSSTALRAAEAKGKGILQHTSIPAENETLEALRAIRAVAEDLALTQGASKTNWSAEEPEENPTAALLSLDKKHQNVETTSVLRGVDQLSHIAHRILLHPPVFITPNILQAYVEIQSCLRKPGTLPEILALYASKPVATPNTSPIRYTYPNPRRISQAVPSYIADLALNAAINTPSRDLPLTLDIITATYRAPAFRRAKIFRRAVPPLSIAAAAPVAAWTLATQFAALQNGMDPAMMTQVAFAGMATYVGAVGTIGMVALTTANDQMERVTWAVGMPLSERWLREDERAAADRVALAWGFRDVARRGEEEGWEWEYLREWLGVRGMVLDRTSAMEGME